MNVQMCLPSVEQDAEASSPSSPRPDFPALPSVCFHFSLPSVPMHISTTLSPSSEVMKILSPQTQGVDEPRPGIATFQTMFLSALHSVGRPFSALWPSFLMPRHCGQLSAETGAA